MVCSQVLIVLVLAICLRALTCRPELQWNEQVEQRKGKRTHRLSIENGRLIAPDGDPAFSAGATLPFSLTCMLGSVSFGVVDMVNGSGISRIKDRYVCVPVN